MNKKEQEKEMQFSTIKEALERETKIQKQQIIDLTKERDLLKEKVLKKKKIQSNYSIKKIKKLN